MAEGVGFEPTVPCGTPVFKTGAIDLSAIPPLCVFRPCGSRTIAELNLKFNGFCVVEMVYSLRT